jgi:polygalacturonase
MYMRKLFFVVTLAFFITTSNAQVFNIKDYGAVSNQSANNAPSIQKAIDACNAAGGGTVLVPAGNFITGTIHLKSNVELHLENGAVLSGSEKLSDYDTYELTGYGKNYYGMLYTTDAENVAITGNGAIDGNNKLFCDFTQAKKIDTVSTRFTRQKNDYRKVTAGIGDGPVVPKERPHQMVIFSNCKTVKVCGIALLNSPFWTLHFADCDNVLVDGIKLWSGLLVPNADGIDVTSCSNVIITNSDIRSGDDALAIVGYDHHFEIPGFKGIKHVSENIIVSNCNLQSYSSGIRIGFLDQNTVRNVHVSHVNITNSTRGIGIFLRDEGSLENISFDDITIETHLRTGDWWGNGEPIHISAVRGKENVKLGVIKNVQFNNIQCIAENGMLLYGTNESMLQNISFNNVSLQLIKSPLNNVAGGNIDLRGCLRPTEQLFASDIPGLYAQFINGLNITNFTLTWDKNMTEPYFTEAIKVKSFNKLKLKECALTAAPAYKKDSIVNLENGAEVITDIKTGLHSKNVSGIQQIN